MATFTTHKVTIDDRNGVEQYFILVVHDETFAFNGKPGDSLPYVSTKGLDLSFVKGTPQGEPDRISTFALGITNRTFEGKGKFALKVCFKVSGEADEIDSVDIVRVGGTEDPDELELVATYVGVADAA